MSRPCWQRLPTRSQQEREVIKFDGKLIKREASRSHTEAATCGRSQQKSFSITTVQASIPGALMPCKPQTWSACAMVIKAIQPKPLTCPASRSDLRKWAKHASMGSAQGTLPNGITHIQPSEASTAQMFQSASRVATHSFGSFCRASAMRPKRKRATKRKAWNHLSCW